MKTQHNYAFSPSLLDAFQRMIDTKAEDFFYQDETGAWHTNWNELEGTLHFSEEEVDALLKKEFIDRVNKVETPPSEAASKGTAFNEILDCLIKKCKPANPAIVIKTVRNGGDLYESRLQKMFYEADEQGMNVIPEELKKEDCIAEYDRIGVPFIYAALDGFEFFFDKDFCIDASNYFMNSICQYYVKSDLETSYGAVGLHGYIDYLRMNKVYDCKTTKRYSFGDFQKKWQRYTYPFVLIESGMMNEVNSFEFTIYVLTGGTTKTPLIAGTQFKEVYTYDHEYARMMLRQQCERLIEFLEANRDLITNEKVFGNG